MEPTNFSKKNIIIIAIIVVVIIMLLVITFLLRTNNSASIFPFNQQPTPEITGSFTGYVEPEFTAEEQTELDQNTELYNLSPYTGDGFTITYDYETFTYQVSAPTEESITNFNNFIAANYASIPKEKFVINGQVTESNRDLVNFLVEQMPVESSTFAVTAEAEPDLPSGYYFLVRVKDQTRGQSDFNAWLQGFNLTPDQINSLDIQFE